MAVLTNLLKKRIVVGFGIGTIVVLVVLSIAWLYRSSLLENKQSKQETNQQDDILLLALKVQEKELEDQNMQLQEERDKLQKERDDYSRLLNELSEIEGNLEALVLEKQKQEDELRRLQREENAGTNLRKLASIYGAMRTASLAKVLPELREDIALEMLNRMEERKVSRLFAALEPKYAANLSAKLNKMKKP